MICVKIHLYIDVKYVKYVCMYVCMYIYIYVYTHSGDMIEPHMDMPNM